MKNQPRLGLAIFFFFLVGGCSNCLFGANAFAESQAGSSELNVVQSLSASFENVAQTIAPSVVSISSVQEPQLKQRGQRPNTPFGNSPFEDFFERFHQYRMPRQGFMQRALGSGVIVDNKGHILTNNHVVDGASEVMVTLENGKKLSAEVVGKDSKTDLAVIKVDAGGLKPAELGDSDELRIGEWVVAVGNPFNLAQTITAGIVSAKGRANVGIADYEDFIQTDAAINPGNSGGPLVNLKGQVIGINTAIFSRSGGNMGIGFAIPVNMAKSVLESLIDEGKVTRGWLGVMIQGLDEGLARSFDYQGTKGALVSEVAVGSPADEGGVNNGDIIVGLDGRQIRDPNQLKNMVAGIAPGTRVELKVVRKGTNKKLRIRLGEMPSQEPVLAAGAENTLGLRVEPLSSEVARRLGIRGAKGVIITGLEPGSLAGLYGLRPNDVILEVEGRSVEDVSQFQEAMAKVDLGTGVRLTVSRGANRFYLFMKKSG